MRTKATGEKSLNWIRNVLLVLVSTLVTLIVVEIVLRLFFSYILYTGKLSRSLYYSTPLFATTKNSAVHYAPNTPLHSIAVYYNKIEYETRYNTNNLGFVSDKNYTMETKDGVLFLGDSFVAGVGSNKPWLPVLDEKYPEINLYSFGVTGTGQKNFYKLFENYQDDLNYSTVVIMPISDDLKRPLWYPLKVENGLFFCYENTTEKQCTTRRLPIMSLIDYDTDADSILLPEGLYLKKAYKVLKNIYVKYKKSKEKQEQEAKKPALKVEKSVTQAKKPIKKVEKSDEIKPKVVPKSPPRHAIGIEYIAKIKELADKKGKKVIFIHIPEKSEMYNKEYRYDIAKRIKDLGIDYYPILHTHNFDKSMYHIHDGHPNDKGYAYISSIVEDKIIDKR